MKKGLLKEEYVFFLLQEPLDSLFIGLFVKSQVFPICRFSLVSLLRAMAIVD
jgi:hypothetical protein